MEAKLEYMYKAIDDTQQTIRFLDTKATAVQVGGIFLAAYLAKIGKHMLLHASEAQTMWTILAYLLGITFYSLLIGTILIAFKAINPMSAPHEHIKNENPILQSNIQYYLWDIKPKPTFVDLFFERSKSKLNHNVSSFYSSLITSPNGQDDDLLKSLVIEFHKLSYIKAKKMFRVSRAILLLKWSIIVVIPLHIAYYYLGWN
ncbi:hypothetical protein EV294_10898 [Paenibacillus sp. BK033]|uniref:hypothetical protein n=1 Tax=Paenibacillus sp. BK033 TaxID=2512133 RepID=UPI00104EB3EE|nr:hypothetical protein [Paenibacillus sp. BK033]TCM92710.1 hypothetical protein EV294_10898 [Paenibacillus sp. BK033]